MEVLAGTVMESDGELLTLVLQNLIGNAVKYSNRGTIRVGFDKGVEEGETVLWVMDEGPGIEPALLEMVFDAFRRGDVHGERGVGLGLTIASQAARLLGGRLTVESQVGAGSTFRVVFGRAVEAGSADEIEMLVSLPTVRHLLALT